MTAKSPRNRPHVLAPEGRNALKGVPIVVDFAPAGQDRGSARPRAVRRAAPERSQRFRHAAQAVFLALNADIGMRFYLWVRYVETAGHGPWVPRPPGVEGWLPIVGLMNTKYFFDTGLVPAIHPAAMFLFMAFVLTSLLLKRSFCSWLCPIGTLSECLWKLG